MVSGYPDARPKLAIHETLPRVLNALVTDLIGETRVSVAALGAYTLDAVRHAPGRLAALSPAIEEERAAAKQFLYDNFYRVECQMTFFLRAQQPLADCGCLNSAPYPAPPVHGNSFPIYKF